MALMSDALETSAHALGTCEPSCTGRPARFFLGLSPVAHKESQDAWQPGALPVWRQDPEPQEGGTSEPSQRVRSHDTLGGIGALPIREAESGVTGRVVASEHTLAGRQGPVPQDMWQHVGAHPAPCLDLKLVCRGTRSARYR
jgi:hypothetical protein